MKKIVDERQELELMKVERAGFWIMWTVLLLSLLVQSLFLGASPKQTAGEHVSFLVGCLIIVIGCVKKGLWGYDSTPCMKTYLSASLIGTLIFTFLLGAGLAFNGSEHVLSTCALFAIGIFSLMFGVLFLIGTFTKHRQKKLASRFEDDTDLPD